MSRWSLQQLKAHEAKHPVKSEVAKPANAWTGRESELHSQIEAELKARQWMYFHGSTSSRTRRTIGEPDYQIFGNNGRFWLVELKTKTGKLSIEQMALGVLAEHLGHKIHVIRSIEEFIQLINK